MYKLKHGYSQRKKLHWVVAVDTATKSETTVSTSTSSLRKAKQDLQALRAAAPVRTFRLLGRTTVFKLVREFNVAGFIPSVTGHTLDGRLQTTARVADIIWL